MFTHLHVHTEYSLLDGLCRIPQLLEEAKKAGMESLAITDHGCLYGAIQFYLQARQAGIEPILGCELYVAPGARQSRGPNDRNPYHLIVLAANQEGYRNLIQLSSKGYLEGFYYKPRVDRELLAEHHAGLIALSACTSGELARLIQEGRHQEAGQAAMWFKKTFGNFYLELQEHNVPELAQVNKALLTMSQELDLPLVATNDVHYLRRSDAAIQDILLCIQTNNTVHNDRRPKMADDSFYLKSPEEMAALFPSLPQAIDNTQRISEMCDLQLEFGRLHLPQVELPEGKAPHEYLSDLCWRGLSTHYPEPTADVRARLAYELDVIRQTDFADYFLVVWDVVAFAKAQNILFGVRGSAAASLVLFCLGITDINPLTHGLVFERFLNLGRREMPDIDLDFQDDRRDELILYVAQRYGADRVAQIITFGTMGAKASLRDVGRALGMPYTQVDRVARLVPQISGGLEKALSDVPELRAAYHEDDQTRRLVDTAAKLEGVARHASTHAAGIVVSSKPLIGHTPLQRSLGTGEQVLPTTQFAMEDIARIGLLKMDFLGLANLTILEKARQIIAQTRGARIDLNQIPLDDERTYALLSAAETVGVFQLEGPGMRRYIRELKPTTLSDIAAMVALYRPGPKQHIPTFIGAKHGRTPISFPHPALKGILEDTYGVIVYQDQVLLITQALAGYSLAEADIVRKAMGKKIPEIMEEERDKFIAGARRQGVSRDAAESTFNLIEPFAGYAFNKAHAVSYALLAYKTAFLKANYPAEFMTALLVANAGNQEKIASAVAECRRLGIPILPPDVSRSDQTFSIERDSNDTLGIRFGLGVIKNVGNAAIEPIIAARAAQGAFKSIEDLCRRADLRGLSKRALESLIKAGALDSLGARGTLLGGMDRMLRLSRQEQELRESSQTTMFDLWGETASVPTPAMQLDDIEVPAKEALAWEKELLGVYVSEHPLSEAMKTLSEQVTVMCGQINEELAGQNVVLAGMVSSVRKGMTKNNRPFVSAVLEDLDGSIEVTAWNDVYERTEDLWAEGAILLLSGKVKLRGDRVDLTCNGVAAYQPGDQVEIPTGTAQAALPSRQVTISLAQTQDIEADVSRLDRMFGILERFPGRDRAYLVIVDGGHSTRLDLPELGIEWCPELHQQLSELLGEEALAFA